MAIQWTNSKLKGVDKLRIRTAREQLHVACMRLSSCCNKNEARSIEWPRIADGERCLATRESMRWTSFENQIDNESADEI